MGRSLQLSGPLRFACVLACLTGSAFAQLCPAAASDMGAKPIQPPSESAHTAIDSCGAGLAARYVGASARADVRDAVRGSVAHDRIRWIMPGMAVTQDHRADRLNVILSGDGRIMTVRCG